MSGQEKEKKEEKGGEKEEEEYKGRKPVNNGDDLGHYRWTQELDTVTVHVVVPDGTRGKMCDIVMEKTRLRVGLKGADPIIEGKLFGPTKVDDSTWSIADGNLITVELAKAPTSGMGGWWKYLLEGDEAIDTQKIEPENSKVDDLDPEAQQMVRKMMFDQKQKQMGLPTSEELKKQEMLKKFQNAHPEFDFSKAKVG